MGLFRRSAKTRGLLPGDAARHLAVYGEHDFGSGAVPGMDTSMFLTSLSQLASAGNAPQVVREFRDLAVEHGGWVAYGAFAAIPAFLPGHEGDAEALEILDVRLAFLREKFGPGEIHQYFNSYDRTRYQQLFPDEA